MADTRSEGAPMTVVVGPRSCSPLAGLLPPWVAVVDAFDDLLPAPLFPEESDRVARAVESRRREFATTRRCARQALQLLGHEPVMIGAGRRGQPLWPAGIVGSLTHCAGYRAAALAPAQRAVALGIDAEPHRPLPAGVLDVLTAGEERRALDDLTRTAASLRWDVLLFCAKEAVFKAWFPLTEVELAMEQIQVSFRRDGLFRARVQHPGLTVAGFGHSLLGSWAVRDGLAVTTVVVDTIEREGLSANVSV